MRYGEFRTRRPEHPMVAEFWRFDANSLAAPVDHVIPPDGLVSCWLVRRRGGAAFCGVTGPTLHAMRSVVEDGMTIIGVRMKPGEPARFFNAPLASIVGAVSPLTALAPAFAAPFANSAPAALDGDWGPLEAAFDALDSGLAPGDRIAAGMATALIESDGELPITGLAAAAGLSPKAARRRFHVAIGLNPKDFARVRRIRRACADALDAGARWSHVSLEAGFADQAHLARECRDIFDMPPRDLRRTLARIRHGAIFSV